jgi:hypothetical protein
MCRLCNGAQGYHERKPPHDGILRRTQGQRNTESNPENRATSAHFQRRRLAYVLADKINVRRSVAGQEDWHIGMNGEPELCPAVIQLAASAANKGQPSVAIAVICFESKIFASQRSGDGCRQ